MKVQLWSKLMGYKCDAIGNILGNTLVPTKEPKKKKKSPPKKPKRKKLDHPQGIFSLAT
jgi:hypothetical protein